MAATALLASSLALGGCSSTDETTAKDTEKQTEKQTQTQKPTQDEGEYVLDGYHLLWQDEFEGEKLNEDIWTREVREVGWTNHELQAYTTEDENIFIRDGKLVLKAVEKQLDNGKTTYTSGKVNSQNKADFTYGKVVVSAKAPKGKGLWPAVWMMPQDESRYGQWPKCGEIDIVEVLGNDTGRAYTTIHYGEPHAQQQGTITDTENDFANDFHLYSVEWEPGEIRFFVDDTCTLTVNDWFTAVEGEDEKPYPAPFDQPFFVQMNLAVGGDWPGDPDENTDFDHAEFEVDYVRVYQKESYDTNVSRPEKAFREPDESGNYIINGDFTADEDLSDDKDWTFYLAEGGAGEAVIRDGILEVKTETEGTVDYSVQMFQPCLPIVKGESYRVTFDAWADEERDMIVCVSAPTAGWIRYLPDTTFGITTERKTYTFDFEMKDKTDNNGRLEFNLGAKGSTATCYFTNVRVEKISE